MAAALALSSALNEDLFFHTNSEPYFLWAKFGDYMPQARQDFANPEFCMNLDKLVKKPQGQKRIKGLQARIAARRAQTAKTAK
jgi:hypothetical protein